MGGKEADLATENARLREALGEMEERILALEQHLGSAEPGDRSALLTDLLDLARKEYQHQRELPGVDPTKATDEVVPSNRKLDFNPDTHGATLHALKRRNHAV